LVSAVPKRLTLKGFIVHDHNDRHAQFLKEVGGWVKEGRIKRKETILQGIENAPRAFLGLFSGENFGKMLVKF
jgi:NADPH-dependent curcumin reductase CurA